MHIVYRQTGQWQRQRTLGTYVPLPLPLADPVVRLTTGPGIDRTARPRLYTPRPPGMGGTGPPSLRIRTSEICVKIYGPPHKPQEGPSEESEV